MGVRMKEVRSVRYRLISAERIGGLDRRLPALASPRHPTSIDDSFLILIPGVQRVKRC